MAVPNDERERGGVPGAAPVLRALRCQRGISLDCSYAESLYSCGKIDIRLLRMNSRAARRQTGASPDEVAGQFGRIPDSRERASGCRIEKWALPRLSISRQKKQPSSTGRKFRSAHFGCSGIHFPFQRLGLVRSGSCHPERRTGGRELL